MANNNKVLTVSYGAFSCTLEGFDDSVGTLKEITEYFRALSASDPRFGEQEMLPDTAKLARIARNNEPRPVDIRTSERGRILLRAEDAEFVPDPDSLSERRADPDIDTDPEGLSLAEVMAKVSEPGDMAEQDPDAPVTDSVSAKLRRLRAVVAQNAAELEDDDQPEDVDTVEEFFAGSYSDDMADALREDTTEPDPDEGVTETDKDEAPDDATSEPETEQEEPHSETSQDPEAEDEAANAEPDEFNFVKSVLGGVEPSGSETEKEAEAEAEAEAEEDYSQPYLLKPEQMISVAAPASSRPDEQNRKVAHRQPDTEELLETPQEPAAEPAAENRPGFEGDELTRLMATAEARMGEPESSNSRETYSHLRAAAAVSKERDVTSAAASDETDNAYRDDLASVVEPPRPAAAKRPDRPRDAVKDAPLKLVAGLRVDGDDSVANRGPVRPRRVYPSASARDTDPTVPQTSFAEYVGEQGATDISDLLEAAAAYLVFVEGRKQFSRPQLMSKLRQIDDAGYDREESLRAFGNLLRDGKIEEAGAGRFTASQEIGFRPADARRVEAQRDRLTL
ncbi:hypothetical protein AB9K34_24180 [Sedimentitalea sp. XS_ASV28]|uniref:hypothetical protein n=1 Tax=Sedimentitalea sp. XS_ASV28 TaxID=3241296 RepID=UPI003515E838